MRKTKKRPATKFMPDESRLLSQAVANICDRAGSFENLIHKYKGGAKRPSTKRLRKDFNRGNDQDRRSNRRIFDSHVVEKGKLKNRLTVLSKCVIMDVE